MSGGAMGDTLYLPDTYQIDALMHRSFIIHELEHAQQDASPSTSIINVAQAELAAYRRQAAYLLTQVSTQPSPSARHAYVGVVAREISTMLAWPLFLEARRDVARFEPILVALFDPGNGSPVPRTASQIHADLMLDEFRLLARFSGVMGGEYARGYAAGRPVTAENRAVADIEMSARQHVDGHQGDSIATYGFRRPRP